MARWLPSKGAAGVSGPKRLPAAIATSRSRRPKRALRGALGCCNGAATFQGHHLPQRRLFAVKETAKHIELSSNPCIGGDPMALAWRMDCNRSRLEQQDVRLRYVGSSCAMTA
ncbi:hypothetical protein XAB3213_3550002 [Xanthomonas citri pv. bilvae]|nr:hypothetical protein XAB3213_3550002 [Xanthomonas citri pv. bilvae]